MKTITSIVVVGLAVFGCISKETKLADQISGAYAREYSFGVIHPESGLEVGTRMIRDTIIIKPIGNKFEVSNRKWMKNDYDEEGWKNMEHSDDRQMPTYQATFSTADNTLNAGFMAPVYFDLEGHLFRKKTLDAPYQRISDLP